MRPAHSTFDLDVVVQTDQQHCARHAQSHRQVGRRNHTHISVVGIATSGAVDSFPNPRDQTDWQEVHGVHQEHPDKHCQRQGADKLARLGIVNNAFGLRVHHFKQDFNGGLHTSGHAGSYRSGDAPHHEHADHTEQHRPKNRVEVKDRKVNHPGLLLRLQMRQVVTNVLTGGEPLRSVFFSSHQLLLSVTFAVKRLLIFNRLPLALEEQRQPIDLHRDHQTHQHGGPAQANYPTMRRQQDGHRYQNLHQLPDKKAGHRVCRIQGSKLPRQTARKQSPGNNHRQRSTGCRNGNARALRYTPSQRRHQQAHGKLTSYHPPGRQGRMLFPELGRLFSAKGNEPVIF